MAKLNSTTITDLEINGTLVINGTEVTPKSAQTYTPNTADQTIPSGKYLVGNQVIKGDANLIPANIKKDVTIFGITGTLVDYATYDTSLPDAGSEQILSGYEAFSFQGVKVVGNIATMAALTNEFTPSSSAQTLTIPAKQYNATAQTITIKAVPSETKTVTAGTSAIDVNATSGKWMTKVTVNPTPSEAKTGIKASTSAAVVVTPASGKLLSSVTIDAINLQAKTGITPTTSQQQITADNDYDGLSSVTIEPIPSQYIIPSGNIELSAQTGTDVTAYATASVQSAVKSISSTRTNITNYFDSGSSSDYDVRIRGSVTVSTAGWIATGTSYGSYTYYKIKIGAVSTPTNQTAIVDSTPSLSGTTITLQASVTPQLTTTGWVDNGNDANQFIAGTVKIAATVPTETKTVKSTTTEQTINPTSGKLISSITVQAITLQAKTGITPTTSQQVISADSGYDGLSKVTIEAMQEASWGTSAVGTLQATVTPNSSEQYVNISAGYTDAKYIKINKLGKTLSYSGLLNSSIYRVDGELTFILQGNEGSSNSITFKNQYVKLISFTVSGSSTSVNAIFTYAIISDSTQYSSSSFTWVQHTLTLTIAPSGGIDGYMLLNGKLTLCSSNTTSYTLVSKSANNSATWNITSGATYKNMLVCFGAGGSSRYYRYCNGNKYFRINSVSSSGSASGSSSALSGSISYQISDDGVTWTSYGCSQSGSSMGGQGQAFAYAYVFNEQRIIDQS